MNGETITKKELEEQWFASLQIDCAKFLTDDEFEKLQGLHRKIKLLKDAEEKKEGPLHYHFAFFGSELACSICNPHCSKNHQFSNVDRLEFCGHPKCPRNQKTDVKK